MHEIAAILNIISSISSTLALDEILAEITRQTAQVMGADSCAISHWDRQNNSVIVLADYISPQAALPPHEDINDVGIAYSLHDFLATARVLHEHTPLIVYSDDPTADEAERRLLKTFRWAGVLMVPMLYKGQAIGLMELYVDDRRHSQFTQDTVALCQALANQAAIAIENARLYREAEEGRLYAEALQVIGRALASDLDYESIVRKVTNFVYPLVGAPFVCVAVPEANGFRTVAVADHFEHDGPGLSAGTSATRLCPDCTERAILKKAPIVVADTPSAPACKSCWQQVREQGLRAMVTIPLLSKERLVGVLAAYAPEPNFFRPEKVTRLKALASQAAVAIQNAQLFTELESQGETLRQISMRLVNAQEEERRRLARELHDELGQTLTALKINLDVARGLLPAGTSAKLDRSLAEARRLAVQTQETARNLSLELHPTLLDDLGLVSALQWELDRYEQRTGQTIHFEAHIPEPNLPPEVEITVYRIIFEALTNVARYAQASHIRVYLQAENGCLVAGVEDDGTGFDVAAQFNAPAERQSLGLVSMRERAGLLGGQLKIISEYGRGTHVQAQLPLNK